MGVLAAAGVLAIGQFASLGWLPDLFVHFRFTVLLAAVVGGLLLIGGRLAWRWRGILLTLAAVVAGWAAVEVLALTPTQARLIYPLPASRAAGVIADPPSRGLVRLRVLTCNVNTARGDFDRLRNVIAAYDPDVIALQEIDTRWENRLGVITHEWRHVWAIPRSDNFGIAIYSRHPLVERRLMDAFNLPQLAVTLEVEGRHVRLHTIHTMPPMTPEYFDWRQTILQASADDVSAWLAADDPRRVGGVVLGDFNLSRYSPHFARYVEAAGVRSVVPASVVGTWPTGLALGPLAIPIDHVLVTQRLSGRATLGGDVGSDHRPLIADIYLPALSTSP